MSAVQCTILMGPKVVAPLPVTLTEAVKEIQVTHSDGQQSGFQITFTAGRGSTLGKLDYPLLKSPLIKAFNRVVLVVTIRAKPFMIMDGIITHVQLSTADQAGGDTIVVTGKDLSELMNREKKLQKFPKQNDLKIVKKILTSYLQYAITAKTVSPPLLDTPGDNERVPTQRATDYEFLVMLAAKYGHTFYVTPTALLKNTAYWGPPERIGVSKGVLSVNMGTYSNVTSMQFRYDPLKPKKVSGKIRDKSIPKNFPVQTPVSTRIPLSKGSLTSTLYKDLVEDVDGLTYQQAQAKAQGQADKSRDNVVMAYGELDVARYGAVLPAFKPVDVRGVGGNYDGTYYVKEVTHILKPGLYQQTFVLTRDGIGTLIPAVSSINIR